MMLMWVTQELRLGCPRVDIHNIASMREKTASSTCGVTCCAPPIQALHITWNPKGSITWADQLAL